MLARLQSPCTEKHRKHTQGQREQKSNRRFGNRITGLAHQHQPRSNRIELQGKIRHRTQHRRNRHHHRNQTRLAVAIGNEIGNRSQAQTLGQRQHATHHTVRKQKDQNRPKINRHEQPTVRHCTTNRAKKRPRRAIHRQRKTVNHRTQATIVQTLGESITGIGNRKQQSDIAKRDCCDCCG